MHDLNIFQDLSQEILIQQTLSLLTLETIMDLTQVLVDQIMDSTMDSMMDLTLEEATLILG